MKIFKLDRKKFEISREYIDNSDNLEIDRKNTYERDSRECLFICIYIFFISISIFIY